MAEIILYFHPLWNHCHPFSLFGWYHWE